MSRELQELVGIILRVIVMYLYALALLRITGKRTLGMLSPLDFLVTLVIGDMFDNIFWGSGPLTYGFFGLGYVITLHVLVSFLSYRFKWFNDIIIGEVPEALVLNGRRHEPGLRRAHISQAGLESELRQHGEDSLSGIKQGFLEPDGTFSLLMEAEQRPVQIRDVMMEQE